MIQKSFDIIGDIAILKIPPQLNNKKEDIAKEIISTNKNISTVLNQISPVNGIHRTRKLEHVFGEKKTATLYKEHKCVFKVDLAEVYFSPRLSFERKRITQLIKQGEIIINMFAGVGTYSILIAKHSPVKMIYSVDINPKAVQLMKKNITLNKVEGKVHAIQGDAKDVIEEHFVNMCDRVLMPLPERAYDYVETAIKALRKERGVLHYYDFVYAGIDENPEGKLIQKVSQRLVDLKRNYHISTSRVVRMVGPRWYQIVLDITIF